MSNKDQYFASLEGKEFTSEIRTRIKKHIDNRASLEERWRRNYQFYYNQHNKSNLSWGALSVASVELAGEQGELVKVGVNHFRNILLHVLNLITGTAPAFQARATNDDAAALAQTRLANSILDFLMRDKNLEDIFETAVEHSLIFDAGYVKVEWDSNEGEAEMVGLDDQPVRAGDVKFSNPTAWDIVFDISKTNFRDNDWVIHRSLHSRYKLMAQYPELIEDLRGVESLNDNHNISDEELDDDTVEVFEFFHKKISSLMPEGRYVQFCGDTVLIDMPLPYLDIPIYQITAGDDLASQFGYSMANDLAPLQEMINAEYSTIMTNHEAFGVQNIAVPREANVNISALNGGMNLIEYDTTNGGNAPHGLNLTQTPVEVFQMMDHLIHDLETISGINSVVRGNPEASLKSGAALALVQNQALAYMNKLQKSYKHLVENVGTGAIRVFQNYATSERTISISGKHHQSSMRHFDATDLNTVKQVTVEMGNPLSRTVAGRIELAGQLISTGLIKTPEEYLNVVETGVISTLTESVTAQLNLIRKENEDLLEGTGARAILIDDHRLHILEHAVVLADPQMRADEQMLTMVLSHIQEHTNFLMSPGFAHLGGLLGYTGMAPMPGMNPDGSTTPPPQGGTVDPAMAQGPQPAADQQPAQMPNMPSPPPGAMPR